MKGFFIKLMLLVALMFFCILLGMQKASEGIQSMRGYDDPDFKSAFSVEELNDGELQASVLGTDITSHDLAAKKKKLEEFKTFNFFSSAGKKISEGVSNLSKKGIEFLTELFEDRHDDKQDH
ncbi:YqxA family protein [Bacillus aquiflavi]|uniref:DUF3679 domain-containing protein n=1 Tax=Bacillus aquiflavi TaxID=2672567 RepID=A0A6B3VVF3_9BACI|nr:YqxA family protein [Bacillus aquiflavi]MBA4535890.1 YqxA family protein [Bacillus aquiflavi]NEY80265.1 DUF3679 domain-containing protein [Bacillus aquiflavi]UAC47309.1 YqxA family protein [Bacillus aquiflavi]